MKKNYTPKLMALLFVVLSAFYISAGHSVSMSGNTIDYISIPYGGFNVGNTNSEGDLDVRISGNAELSETGGVMIVRGDVTHDQRGGVFFSNPIQQNTGFSATFQMYMGDSNSLDWWGVADGFAFVMAQTTNQVGASGQGIGYSGVGRSIAIEYDIFDNKDFQHLVPHIWYGLNGKMDTSDSNREILFEEIDGVSPWKNATHYYIYGWIEYNAAVNELMVFYSSNPECPEFPTMILRQSGGISGWINGGKTYVVYDSAFNPTNLFGTEYYVGFTAATAAGRQEITLMQFSAQGEVFEPPSPPPPPGCCIDYRAGDIIATATDAAHSKFAVNLTTESLTIPANFTAAAYSTNGGAKWKNIKPEIQAQSDDKNPLNSLTSKSKNNFARLLRKGLILHLSDKPYDSRKKQLEAGAVEVKFPKIDPAIPLPKLAVNYLFGENEPSHYGEFNGQWLMATKVKKGQTPVVDKSVQIGLAVMFPNAKNPAKPPKPGKTVDENGWGEFYPGETNGICVKELEKNTKGKDMTVKTTYFYRTAPRLNDDGTTFTAASKPKKIRALSQLKRPKYKIGQNKAKADTTYVNGTPYAKKAQFTLTSGDVVWHGATVKKPASATQLAN